MVFKFNALRAIIVCLCLNFITLVKAENFAEPVENLFHPQGLQGELDETRKFIEEAYYELVQNKHFDSSYLNNLVIDLKLQGSVQKEGMIVLALIEWLARQNDEGSISLLRKLNELYFLEFTRFIVSLDSSKTRSTDLLEDFQALYHYTLQGDKRGTVEPFRATLSKLILLIYMVNESELRYEHRKETLALALDKLKAEMLRINDVYGEARLERSIKSFVTLLEVYAVREPLVKPRTMEKVVYGTIAVVVLALVIHKVVLNWGIIKPKIDDGVYYFKESIVKPIIRTIAEVFVDVLTERGLFRNAGAQIVDGMVWQYVPPPPGQAGPSLRVPSENMEILANALHMDQVGNGIENLGRAANSGPHVIRTAWDWIRGN